MNKAQYLSTAPESGGNGRYPLSTQALNFAQAQAELLQELARIGGTRYILKQPDGNAMGYIVIDGELLPLSGNPKGSDGIRVYQETEDIHADGETYTAARIIRYAKYQAKYVKDVDDLYPASAFDNVATNAQLKRRVEELDALRGLIAARLEIRSGIYTAVQIDKLLDNVRLQCRKGSAKINGAESYTLNVYRTGSTTAANGAIESIVQEQIMPDLRRFTRQYDPAKGTWSKWTFVTDNFHLEVKVVRGTTVWVRHGEVPVGVNLVLLRKKKRSCWRRYKVRRQGKNQYVHYKGVILTLGEPNKWYVPKCTAVGDNKFDNCIGKELGSICADLIQTKEDQLKIRYTSIKITPPTGSNLGRGRKTGYAKVGLQFASAGTSYKGSGGEMVKMKYRVWFDKNKQKNQYTLRHGFSVE